MLRPKRGILWEITDRLSRCCPSMLLDDDFIQREPKPEPERRVHAAMLGNDPAGRRWLGGARLGNMPRLGLICVFARSLGSSELIFRRCGSKPPSPIARRAATDARIAISSQVKCHGSKDAFPPPRGTSATLGVQAASKRMRGRAAVASWVRRKSEGKKYVPRLARRPRCPGMFREDARHVFSCPFSSAPSAIFRQPKSIVASWATRDFDCWLHITRGARETP